MRSLAVLSDLSLRHDLLVLAGRDAREVLAPRFPVEPIPCLTFGYHGGRLSTVRTLRQNAGLLADIAFGRGAVRHVEARLSAFRPDVVVSDSEPLVLHAAARLGIPRIGFDHVGVIAWCRPEAPPGDALRLGREAAAYRLLLGRPERIIVSSFYPAPPRTADVACVPPVLRERVLRASPVDGPQLLVYLNQPQLFTPPVLAAIAAAGIPAIAYGAGREDREGPIQFKPFDEAAFVEDLARARALLCTAGHQLASEAIHLGKPMLVCPEASAEQRLNARELERLGVARQVSLTGLSAGTLRAFLDDLDRHRARLAAAPRDGNARAVGLLEASARALVAGRPPAGAARLLAGAGR
jgi:uncharacterized protein (TIGR00661 family)